MTLPWCLYTYRYCRSEEPPISPIVREHRHQAAARYSETTATRHASRPGDASAAADKPAMRTREIPIKTEEGYRTPAVVRPRGTAPREIPLLTGSKQQERPQLDSGG
jgi:hypothetical protein